MGVVWGIVVGGIYWLFKRDNRGALVVGLCVLSHWFFDLIVHTEDLPLTPWSNYKVGLGLWNYPILNIILETAIFLIGVYMYSKVTRPKNGKGKWGFWTLIILLLLIHFANTFSTTPPDSVMFIFVAATIMMTVLVSLAYWVDRNREPR